MKTETGYRIALHGGAGTIADDGRDPTPWQQALLAALDCGSQLLAQGGSALQAVLATVQALEDCPLFNAGRGAVYNAAGGFELEASVMDGAQRRCGSVALLPDCANPVRLAQAVLEQGGSVFLAGSGAQAMARAQGMPAQHASYFATAQRLAQWQAGQADGSIQLDHDAPLSAAGKLGTVGAVARDRAGNLAAATSTGGMSNKPVGRIGDTPLIGAGCYAENGVVAVSCTGQGEYFVRTVLAHQIACRLRFAGQSLAQASAAALAEMQALGGSGGLVAIDAAGNICLPFTTRGMYRAWQQEGTAAQVAVF